MISFEYFTTVKSNFFIPLPVTRQTSPAPTPCAVPVHPSLSQPLIFLIDDFLKSSFRLTAKLRELPYATYPYICLASPIFNIFHTSGTFVKTDEPTLTHRYDLESLICITAHSWCYTSYGFGWMSNDIYPSLWVISLL